MKANITLIGAIIAFTSGVFQDIDKYIEKGEDK